MAYMDEIEVGDRVTVHDRCTVFIEPGTVEALVPDETRGPGSTVCVRLDSGRVVSVNPEYVTLQVGEES
jgi:hypothetical protein